jgi:hypothetical protein
VQEVIDQQRDVFLPLSQRSFAACEKVTTYAQQE